MRLCDERVRHNDFDPVLERSLGRVHPMIFERTMRKLAVGGLLGRGERVRKERVFFASLLERVKENKGSVTL